MLLEYNFANCKAKNWEKPEIISTLSKNKLKFRKHIKGQNI